jgi:hypothetical protein
MKKLLTFVATLTLVCALFLTGCVNQGMADKINEKTKAEGGYTYEQLLKDYKNPTISAVAPNVGGVVLYIDGCKDKKEADQKYKNGEEIQAVYVYVAFNMVTEAKYMSYNPDKA